MMKVDDLMDRRNTPAIHKHLDFDNTEPRILDSRLVRSSNF